MFERYTERARRVIFFARYEASALGGDAIGGEHLLLGLLRLGGDLDAVLGRVGIDHQGVRARIESEAGGGERASTSVDMPLSGVAKRALAAAADEAREGPIDATHLLLGLVRAEPAAVARWLGVSGLRIDAVREACSVLRPQGPPEPRAAFEKLGAFLVELERHGLGYRVSPAGESAIQVELSAPGLRSSVTFSLDGGVTVQELVPGPGASGDAALARLLERLPPPR